MHEESYVVRIYRRDIAVVGVVEAVLTGWRKPAGRGGHDGGYFEGDGP